MNRKGEMSIAMLLVSFVAIVVGLALFIPSAQYVGDATTIYTSTNASFTLPANLTTADLSPCGQLNTSVVTIYNETNGTAGFQTIVPAANYTITQAAGTDGYLTTRILLGEASGGFYSYPSNVTCSFQPKGYITSAGGRSIASLIIIFAGLAVAVMGLSPTLRSKIIDQLS